MSILKMKYLLALLCFLSFVQSSFGQTSTTTSSEKLDQPTLNWMQTILDNWETVCHRDLEIPLEPLPWIIFYDERQALHLNPDQKLLPAHQPTSASLKFAGKSYALQRVNHDKKLWLPGNQPLTIDINNLQEVAMLYDKCQKTFFIAPLPSLYHKLAPPDQPSVLDELFIGNSAHELTHTRQLVYFGRQIEALRKRYKLPESLDDNIIEREFKTNTVYKKLYEEEKKLMTQALLAKNQDDCLPAVRAFLAVSEQRQKMFFTKEKDGYKELEDIFLSLEGLAMWAQFKTARDRAPKDEEWLKTLITLAQRSDSWSQEEGLGLFLLIERLVPNWKQHFTSENPTTPFVFLRKAINKSAK